MNDPETSDVVVAKSLSEAQGRLNGPAGPDLARFSSRDNLVVLVLVGSAAVGEGGKPDVRVDVEFLRDEGGALSFINRVAAQAFNARTLPPSFDAARQPLPAGQEVPLSSFGPGRYVVRASNRDLVSGATTTREAAFVVF